MRLKFKVNLGRDKRESRRPFPGIRDNEHSTIPPKTGRVVTLISTKAISAFLDSSVRAICPAHLSRAPMVSDVDAP